MSSTQQTSTTQTAAALATLQPLRDLAKNWDIDIASCLEEYLQELGHDLGEGWMQEDDNDNEEHDVFNFAQAALVLQNSSHIYSAKVEYLYNLVYQALVDFGGSNSSSSAAQKKRSGEGWDAATLLEAGPGQQFLPLDDDCNEHGVLPVDESEACRHINLKPAAVGNGGSISNNHSLSVANTTHLETTMGHVTLPSTSISTTGRASLMGAGVSLDANSQHSLRLVGDAHADVNGATGALLLPGAATGGASQPPHSQSPGHHPSNHDDDGDFPLGGGDDDDDMVPPPFDDDDHDNDGAGFAFAGPDDEEGAKANNPPTAEPPRMDAPKAAQTAVDPWALLDPHDTTNAGGGRATTRKPLRIGKTIQLPGTLQLLPSECVTGARTRQRAVVAAAAAHKNKTVVQTTAPSLATETFRATLQAARRKRNHGDANDNDSATADDTTNTSHNDDSQLAGGRPLVPLKGLVFGNEFAYIAKATAKRKAAERRERRKRLQQQQADVPKEEEAAAALHDDDDDGGFVAAFDDGDDDDDFGVQAHDDDENDNIQNNTGGFLSVDQVYETSDALEDSWNGVNSDEEGHTFEELCRAHISNFRRGAEKYASETQLSQRVGHWQDKLAPLLEQEEQRPVFDIQQYGQTVLASMEQDLDRQRQSSKDDSSADLTTKTVNFCEVTRHAPQYQVCRFFLAALSLSNSGNVQLSTEEEKDDKVGGLTSSLVMELLTSSSSVMEHQSAMEKCLAPSVASTQEVAT